MATNQLGHWYKPVITGWAHQDGTLHSQAHLFANRAALKGGEGRRNEGGGGTLPYCHRFHKKKLQLLQVVPKIDSVLENLKQS